MQYRTSNAVALYRAEITHLFGVAFFLFLAQLAQPLKGYVSTIMLGRIGDYLSAISTIW